MSQSDNNIIQPSTVPLSHLGSQTGKEQNQANSTAGASNLGEISKRLTLGLCLVALLGFIGWQWSSGTEDIMQPASTQNKPQEQRQDSTTPDQIADTDSTANVESRPERLSPFAQSQHQRMRERAQQSLSKFVERQIQLEENMQVGSWGQNQLDAAMELAHSGDAQFADEQFEPALATYERASTLLADLIKQGDEIYDSALAATELAINQLELDQATTQIAQALRIKPNSADAEQLNQRVLRLPEIITQMRTAKNHELGNRPEQAMDIYQQISGLEPNLLELAENKRSVQSQQVNKRVSNALSQGFAALEKRQFESARKAFNSALALDPSNDMAKGGLAQVSKDNDLATIKNHQLQAELAVSRENWQQAAEHYQAVLDLDPNIQFAVAGLRKVTNHSRSAKLLSRIANTPEKLSNQKLYLDAIEIVGQAKELELAGPNLKQAIGEVEQLIALYRDPVDVLLVSDNATEVIVSNVGRIGTFSQKTLSLRPGQYTIRGSQDGCKDIYLSLNVLPGIEPINLSCPESL